MAKKHLLPFLAKGNSNIELRLLKVTAALENILFFLVFGQKIFFLNLTQKNYLERAMQKTTLNHPTFSHKVYKNDFFH